jgi:hypothetical protein
MTWATVSTAADIYVPADQPTIQAGINAAVNGDRVLVSPGTYFEHIDLKGKNILLASTDGPSSTTIDGSNSGTVVMVASGERGASLEGFTIAHGTSNGATAGGVFVGADAILTVQRNDFESNRGSGGSGIRVDQASAIIRDNTFRYNGDIAVEVDNCRKGRGVSISDNLFESNDGAIGIGSSKAIVIKRNVIRHNGIPSGYDSVNLQLSDVVFADNLVYQNSARTVFAVQLQVTRSDQHVEFVNNTISENEGGDLWLEAGPYGTVNISNNIFQTAHKKDVVYCVPRHHAEVQLSHNLFFALAGSEISGSCDWTSGKLLTSNPSFAGGHGDGVRAYWLMPDSPAIDAGDDAAVQGHRDLTNAQRIQGAAVDLGAIEFRVD